MFTTGTKFLIGASVIALVATIVYGVGQDGVLGTVGLASATVGLVALTVLNAILRDSNVFADDEAPVDTTAAAQYAPGASVWPLGFAFGAVVVAVGLISYQPIVVIGLVALAATGGEWVVQAWAERASGDPGYNAQVRNRLSNSLEYPVAAAVGIGILVYAFSRVMLWLSKTNTVVAFTVLAATILLIGFTVANRRNIKAGAVGGVAAIGAVAVVVAGAVTGLDGERDIPVFETTTVWQEEAILHPVEYAEGAAEGKHPAGLICESLEEFPEADENVSETVANKSGAYQVFLSDSGQLSFDVPGPIEFGATAMSIPRSNPTNVIFRNESDERRRLSLDLGLQTVEVEEGGETIEVEAPRQLCTTLIEPGGAQLVTVVAREPSFAAAGVENPNGPPGADGYWFFVPGVDTAKLELVVP